jgi:hypothetical protein
MSNAIFKRSEVKDWNPTKYISLCCKTVIWSSYPGEWKACTCGKSFVDETNYYARLGGTVEEYIKVTNEES